VIRCAGLVAIGYVFGASFPRAIRIFGAANMWLLGALVLAMAVLFVVRRRKLRRQALESGASDQDRVDRGTP
jgi:hypothetical protein